MLAACGLQGSRDLVTLTSARAIGAVLLFLIGRYRLRRSPRYRMARYEFLTAWVIFSACSNAFRDMSVPAFATGVGHDLLLGLGLYLGLQPRSSPPKGTRQSGAGGPAG